MDNRLPSTAVTVNAPRNRPVSSTGAASKRYSSAPGLIVSLSTSSMVTRPAVTVPSFATTGGWNAALSQWRPRQVSMRSRTRRQRPRSWPSCRERLAIFVGHQLPPGSGHERITLAREFRLVIGDERPPGAFPLREHAREERVARRDEEHEDRGRDRAPVPAPVAECKQHKAGEEHQRNQSQQQNLHAPLERQRIRGSAPRPRRRRQQNLRLIEAPIMACITRG